MKVYKEYRRNALTISHKLEKMVVQFILSNSHTSHKPQMLEDLHKISWSAKITYKIHNNMIIEEVKTNYLK